MDEKNKIIFKFLTPPQCFDLAHFFENFVIFFSGIFQYISLEIKTFGLVSKTRDVCSENGKSILL